MTRSLADDGPGISLLDENKNNDSHCIERERESGSFYDNIGMSISAFIWSDRDNGQRTCSTLLSGDLEVSMRRTLHRPGWLGMVGIKAVIGVVFEVAQPCHNLECKQWRTMNLL